MVPSECLPAIGFASGEPGGRVRNGAFRPFRPQNPPPVMVLIAEPGEGLLFFKLTGNRAGQ